MKRLLSAALALTLMSGSVAYAEPPGGWGHHDRDRGFDHRGRDFDRGHFRGRHDDTGAAIAVGVGMLGLIAILAAQDRERRDAQYAPPPPPPPPPGYGRYSDQGAYQGGYPDQGAYRYQDAYPNDATPGDQRGYDQPRD